MPVLKFFVTKTRLPLEKVCRVVGGYTMVRNCAEHHARNTAANPKLHFIQELVIASKQYPAALLRPWGYTAQQRGSSLSNYPRRTLFFYKHHVSEFDAIRGEFDAAPENAEFLWSCGCRVRKYSQAELEELCKEPWYPWCGEREPALFTFGKLWKPRRRTGTPEEIADALLEGGVISNDQVSRVVEVIRSHRVPNAF